MKRRFDKLVIAILSIFVFFLLCSCYQLKVANDLWIESLVESLKEIEKLESQIKKDPNVAISVYGDFSLASGTSLTR